MTSNNMTEAEPVAPSEAVPAKSVDDRLIDELVGRAQAEGLQLTGEGGLLQQLTKRLLESALEGEITDHLGYDKHDPAGKNGGNSRNGTRAKTVLTDVGPVGIAVPRDREGSFEPRIVKKRQKRLSGVDEMVISLAAKGLTTGEVQAHLAEVYGAEVSRQTISTITDKVLDGMAEWQNRPLDAVFRYAARQDWDKIARVLKPVYTATTEEAALDRFAEFADAWGKKYPAIVRLWENAWEEFTPFLRFDTEIRRIVCTTNAIESVNARIRRAVKARGHFPNEQAALKCVYMAIMSLDPTGKGQARWTMRWKTALNAFDITFDGRLSAARQ
ncbi:IS256 family transposase [Streptomyces dangxiongensis]|uniref:Mutator family transposase n=2 Tax=Streptomyces dangxiongensis TaxID=1442032 RepID=A0A3G2JLK2_9ACTN|nr:transposase [Streptomyces dangxiongensis]AYN43308.1 IS256 family transposase [Streptomyces dangxiongensis]